MTNIAQCISAIKKRIARDEIKYHRPAGSVQLLAVTKHQSLEKIKAAIDAGQCAFGESYLQEALPKIAALSDVPLEWHFIGPIQRNKTRKIAEHFQWVQSVDSLTIAKRLNEQRPIHLGPLNICIEVNSSDEPSKSGIPLHEVASFIANCRAFPHLKIRGLMAIPAPASSLSQQRERFHSLLVLWQSLNASDPQFDTLSIGMSDDFEAAIAEGSTMVRLGTALFGKR